jgi:predicted nucleic acid-binding protein
MTGTGILVDTWAWLEMMTGSGPGDRVRTVIRNNPDIFISVLTLYELRYQVERLQDYARAESIASRIASQAGIILVDTETAILAGAIKADQKKRGSSMGAVDCMILATARLHGLKILSGDKHFTGLEECLEISGS